MSPQEANALTKMQTTMATIRERWKAIEDIVYYDEQSLKTDLLIFVRERQGDWAKPLPYTEFGVLLQQTHACCYSSRPVTRTKPTSYVGRKGRMQRFHAKDPEKSKLGTHRAIRQGPGSEYNMYGKHDTYGEYNSCREYSTHNVYGMYSECDMYREYGTYKKYSTYRECNMYSEYNKYNKAYNKVATANYQALNRKGKSKGGFERYRKDTLSWFSPQGFFTGFIEAL